MLIHISECLERIEKKIGLKYSADLVYFDLRELGLEDFSYVLSLMPILDFPKISYLLPKMASQNVQQSWTGNYGVELLKQSLAFVRSISSNYAKFCYKSLEGARILDFGCGYGRIARCMYYFTDTKNYFGLDPWDKSLDLCKQSGLGDNFYLSEYLPNKLPFSEKSFNLIFAFSVFTHLSEKATKKCLNTLIKYIEPQGIIVITIRPAEYWDHYDQINFAKISSKQIEIHKTLGFAFLPHNREKIQGDVTYGDTSMSLDWIKSEFPNLKILAVDRSLIDPLQRYIFLQAT